MKKLLLLFMVLFLAISYADAQNHVSNASFEQYNNCPTAASQVTSHCTGWRSYSTSTTPDYYNSCHTSTNNVGVPLNFAGYQHAARGNAYCGFIAFSPTTHFEYLATQIQPLQPGVKYEVSLSVNLVNNFKFATDNIGVFFYDTRTTTVTSTAILAVTPQVYFSNYGVIRDTQNWVRLTKSFVADSAYDNIVIGAFNNSSNTFTLDTFNTSIPNNMTGLAYAYYLVDSVVIKRDDSFHVASGTDSLGCANDTLPVKYSTPVKYNSNNIFTAQLSNKTGSFSSPINIGTKSADTSGTITCILPANISPGTGYKVRVIASSPADTTKNQSVSIKIGNIDSAGITTSSNSPLCEGNSIDLHAGTNVGGTFLWTGPNSFTSTSANTAISGAGPAHSGNYYITIKFYGCEVKDTLAITVKPLPSKPVANNNTPLCAGETVNITASSSTGGVSYSWTGPGSYTSTTQNPTLTNSTVAMSGDYIVTATLNGCNTKDTTSVTVKPLPASVTLTSNTPICAGSTLLLNSTTSTTGSSYAWTGPNSFTSATQNSSISNATPAATGLYKITVSLNGCTYKDSILATVHPIPATPNITFNSPICIGETLNLNASTVTGATYSWTGPNSFASSNQNPTRSNMQFGDTGSYSVTATANGCTSPAATAKVYINALPFVVIFATPGDSICQGAPVVFTALPNNSGGTPQYQWLVNAQPAGAGMVFNSSTLNNKDVVRCDMTESTKCSSPYTDQSNEIEMRVLPWLAPSVTISANPNRPLEVDEFVTFTATTSNAGNNPKHQWKRNGNNIQGATGNIWSANTLSDYDSISVEIISNYKCPLPIDAKSNGIVVKVNSSVGNVHAINGLTLYPNPNNGKFILKGTSFSNENIQVEIINAVGQVVYKDLAVPQSGVLNKEIEMDCNASGVYLLKLNSGNGTTVLRFTVR